MRMGALGCFRAPRAEKTASGDMLTKQRFRSGLVLASATFALMYIMGVTILFHRGDEN